uniref:hypothetical protein n=1 Tax=Salinispora arenicola TaxID=168697 RepID=UPI000576AD87
LSILVRAGKTCHLRGFAWESGDTEFSVPVTANTSGQTRIDLVVLRLTRPGYAVTIEVCPGVPGAGAPPAPMRQYTDPGVWEIVLGTVTVAHNATAVSAFQAVSTAWLVHDDGTIRAYSTNRPPMAVGRQFWEIDTSRVMLCTGTTWVMHREDTGWITCPPSTHPPSASGWSTDQGGYARVRRLNGVVTLAFELERFGTTVPNSVLAVCCDLPPSPDPSDPTRGFAPQDIDLVALGGDGWPGDTLRVEVWPDGSVYVGAVGDIPSGRSVSGTVSYPLG